MAAQRLAEYGQFLDAQAALGRECQKVVADNKWPKETSCDANTLVFTPPAKAPEEKKN